MVGKIPVFLAIVGLLGCWSFFESNSRTNAAEENTPPKQTERKLSKFMKAKLASADLILEGLCVEDFEKIEKGAIQMQVISIAEEWRVTEDPLYLHHSEEFRRVAKQLRQRAHDKNLEGAALSYLEMTMSCVDCHRFVREVLLADQQFPQINQQLFSSLKKLHTK